MLQSKNERIRFGRSIVLAGAVSLSIALGAGCTVSESSSPAISDTKSGETTKPAGKPQATVENAKFVRFEYASGELAQNCQAAIDKANKRITEIVSVPKSEQNFENSMLAFENTMAELSDETSSLTFMSYVSTSEALSAEGTACEEKLGEFYVEVFSRRDIYNVLAAQTAASAIDARLLKETLKGFEANGLKLSDAELALVKDLKTQLSKKETQFSFNLNSDKSTAIFTADELNGVPADFLERWSKNAEGNYIVSTKSTDYVAVMENADSEVARKRMQIAYLNRGGAANTQLLQEALVLRSKIAKAMGYNNWADLRMNDRMAKDAPTVLNFLNGLKEKLAQRNQDDFAKLLEFKKTIDPTATVLNQWDTAYISNLLKKRDYQLDDEKIREYFPAEVVVAGMFETYSKMLGVQYKEVVGAKVWAEGVKLYEIRNTADGRLIGYFYADFFPRDGKYGHAAAFTLIAGRALPDLEYNLPISSIVANFSPPTAGKPSLLMFDEVETIFHEFGHIMHQTLTRAPYASLSGSSTSRDFVEAPSQMLENWVWDAKVLSTLSGHYLDNSKKLPAELQTQMLSVRKFNQGIAYTKQLLYALFDMTIHSQDPAISVDDTYNSLYRQIIKQEPLLEAHFPAGFGHMMGGYDGGYYGYLWSEVYAQDMFSTFPSDDLTSSEVGGRYRRAILENGNTRDAADLLREFLGREPSADAFFKKLGF